MRVGYLEADLGALAGERWAAELEALTDTRSAIRRIVYPNSPTSRESNADVALVINVVPGDVLVSEVPWLERFYRFDVRALASSWAGIELFPARDIRSGVNLNIMSTMDGSYECHVDSNAIQAILYVTDDFEGGELIIAHREVASSPDEVDADNTAVKPKAGALVAFDGRTHPHYVRQIISGGPRVALVLNYYSREVPESWRPASLNGHLYGEAAG